VRKDDIVRKINARLDRVEIAPLAYLGVLLCGAVTFFALVGRSFWLAVAIAALILVRASSLRASLVEWDLARRTTRLVYPSDVEFHVGWELIRQACATLGRLPAMCPEPFLHDDLGLAKSIGAHCVKANVTLPFVETNVAVWSLTVGARKLFFLPDRILVWTGNHYQETPYPSVEVRLSTQPFKGKAPPPGADKVTQSWQHVRRDGQPDRRYKQNDTIYLAGGAAIQTVSADTFDTGVTVTLTGQQRSDRTAEIPAGAYAGDGAAVIRIVRTNAAANAFVNVIALEEITSLCDAPDLSCDGRVTVLDITLAAQAWLAGEMGIADVQSVAAHWQP